MSASNGSVTASAMRARMGSIARPSRYAGMTIESLTSGVEVI